MRMTVGSAHAKERAPLRPSPVLDVPAPFGAHGAHRGYEVITSASRTGADAEVVRS